MFCVIHLVCIINSLLNRFLLKSNMSLYNDKENTSLPKQLMHLGPPLREATLPMNHEMVMGSTFDRQGSVLIRNTERLEVCAFCLEPVLIHTGRLSPF